MGAGHFFGTLATALFLGAPGTAAYGLSKNIAVGYMVSIIYYAMNFAGSKLPCNFYLFSMMLGIY